MKQKKLIESLKDIFYDQLLKECDKAKNALDAYILGVDVLASYAKENRLPDKMDVRHAVTTTRALENFSLAFIEAGGHHDDESMKAYHYFVLGIQYNIIVSLHQGFEDEN